MQRGFTIQGTKSLGKEREVKEQSHARVPREERDLLLETKFFLYSHPCL